jgi:hypothetical protein
MAAVTAMALHDNSLCMEDPCGDVGVSGGVLHQWGPARIMQPDLWNEKTIYIK